MRKLRCREVKGLSQGHRADKWQSWDVNQAVWFQVHALNHCDPLSHVEKGMIGKYNCNGQGESRGVKGAYLRGHQLGMGWRSRMASEEVTFVLSQEERACAARTR